MSRTIRTSGVHLAVYGVHQFVLIQAADRSFTRLMAATDVRMPRTADPTSSAGRSVRPGFGPAMREHSTCARLSAVDLLMRNSTVTSLSDSDCDAKWTTQRVDVGCVTDAIRARQRPRVWRSVWVGSHPGKSSHCPCPVSHPRFGASRTASGTDAAIPNAQQQYVTPPRPRFP